MKITAKLKNFGILVIRTIWPGKSTKGAARVGAVLLGIGVLIGVGKASGIDTLISGIFGGGVEARKETKPVKVDNKTALAKSPAKALSSNMPNGDNEPASSNVTIVEMIGESETIVRGGITEVTDGIENGLPYTEVTMQVSEASKG